jgi:hypothetical protein
MLKIIKFTLASIIVLLTENATYACEGYNPERISNASLIYKLIHGPLMLIATATYNLSPETLDFISLSSIIIFSILAISTFFYVLYIFYKNNLLKRLCVILLCMYFVQLFLTVHKSKGNYFCNGRPSAVEVLSLLFTSSQKK